MNRKGIILAGGSGTRLYPTTKSVSKQLLPIYDKPMIYYSLSILMLANIREILVVVNTKDKQSYIDLLGDGEKYGISLDYIEQPSPDGIAHAFIIGEKFLDSKPVAMILGDNIFYGQGLVDKLKTANARDQGATVFGYQVKDPERFGVVEFKDNKVLSIEEKPMAPKSNFAVSGLYFYDENVAHYAKQLSPSSRGELEITDLNKIYLENNQLNIEILGRGFAWLDTGTNDSLIAAAQFVQTIEHRQGFKIACLEEIAFRSGWITEKQMIEQASLLKHTSYGQYLFDIIN